MINHRKLSYRHDGEKESFKMEMSKAKFKKYMELTDKVLNLIDNQAEDKMSRGDLQGCVEAIIMQAINYTEPEIEQADKVEKKLRDKWTADGVPKEKQDAIIADVTAKAQPGTHIGPFIIG